MENFTREILGKGISLTFIGTEKFKTSVMSMSLVLPLSGLNCAEAAILPAVLRRGTKNYPDMETLGAKLDSLYGARIEPSVHKRGESLVFGFVSDVIDEKFAKDGEQLTLETAKLLGELMFEPILENGGFKDDYVDGEKENLKDRIAAQVNDKRSYAVRRLYEIMCENEAFGKSELGTVDSVSKIKPDSLYSAYKKFLETAEIELFYCGSQDIQKVKAAFSEAVKNVSRGEVTQLSLEVISRVGNVRTIVEEMDITQGKLSLGFRTGITARDAEYPALVLLNTCFGGSTSSKLFLNVREKMSLCYYASSSVEKLKGVMAVASGIENDKFEVARDEILSQLKSIQTGNLSDDEVASAKKTVLNTLKSMKDSPLNMENFYVTQAIGGLSYDIDHLIQGIENATRDQIIAAANRIKLDVIYFLKGVARND